ncbi:DUF6328 family protein [Actinoallomurus soli]|uniref:DUF6328 family protein n=1 Tax=Actinoallomurus soli TaxID=2952535 RepID=UPI0020921772|nr:DUF6328 family protein [Actinoallomurus soli]MCO5974665.1 DUF6328 family protein [Actinoallomurus soli]
MGTSDTRDTSKTGEPDPRRDETPRERFDRELVEMLQGLRVIVAGVQFLFAFLLTLPFSNGFKRVGHTGQWVFYLSLITAACASICLMAPAAQHRMLFRSGRKDLLVNRSNRYGIAGTLALTVSMASAVAVAAKGFFSSGLAAGTAAGFVLIAGWAWFVQPMVTRRRIYAAREADAEKYDAERTEADRRELRREEAERHRAERDRSERDRSGRDRGDRGAEDEGRDAAGEGREAPPRDGSPAGRTVID